MISITEFEECYMNTVSNSILSIRKSTDWFLFSENFVIKWMFPFDTFHNIRKQSRWGQGPANIYSKTTMETLEKRAKCVQS